MNNLMKVFVIITMLSKIDSWAQVQWTVCVLCSFVFQIEREWRKKFWRLAEMESKCIHKTKKWINHGVKYVT